MLRFERSRVYFDVVKLSRNKLREFDLPYELTRKSASELAQLIRSRAISSVEVVTEYFERIEKLNPSLNAVVTLAEDAIDRARAADIVLATMQKARRAGSLESSAMIAQRHAIRSRTPAIAVCPQRAC